MKIVLVGYMGSGKTTVGRILSENLKIEFLDLDNYIAEREKMNIPEIFSKKGEIYFRKKELEYLKEVLAEKEDVILSTGGGTPCYGQNMNVILEHTDNVFYLKVSLPELVNRLAVEKTDRPLIKNIPDGDLLEFIGKHLFERSFFYSQAHITISCDGKPPKAIATEIKNALV